MARVFSSGFELQSVVLASFAFGEFDAAYSSPPGTISTSIKRSGDASFRISGSISGTSLGIIQDTHNGTSNKKMWLRAYVLFEAFPSAEVSVIGIGDNNISSIIIASITSSGQMQFNWVDSGGTVHQAGSPSSALNLHQWYRLEISGDVTTSTAWSGEMRIDGSTIATFSGANGGSSACASIHFFAATPAAGGSASGIDQYYDDIACNDASGSVQNSWPGDGKIVHLHPDAAGDNNAWRTGPTDAAGTTNNFTFVDEINPDNATGYVKRSTSATPIDDYNCELSSSQDIGASDIITLVQVGCRIGANSNTSTNRAVNLRIKGQSGGTVQTSPSALNWAINGWGNHQVFSTTGPVLGR